MNRIDLLDEMEVNKIDHHLLENFSEEEIVEHLELLSRYPNQFGLQKFLLYYPKEEQLLKDLGDKITSFDQVSSYFTEKPKLINGNLVKKLLDISYAIDISFCLSLETEELALLAANIFNNDWGLRAKRDEVRSLLKLTWFPIVIRNKVATCREVLQFSEDERDWYAKCRGYVSYQYKFDNEQLLTLQDEELQNLNEFFKQGLSTRTAEQAKIVKSSNKIDLFKSLYNRKVLKQIPMPLQIYLLEKGYVKFLRLLKNVPADSILAQSGFYENTDFSKFTEVPKIMLEHSESFELDHDLDYSNDCEFLLNLSTPCIKLASYGVSHSEIEKVQALDKYISSPKILALHLLDKPLAKWKEAYPGLEFVDLIKVLSYNTVWDEWALQHIDFVIHEQIHHKTHGAGFKDFLKNNYSVKKLYKRYRDSLQSPESRYNLMQLSESGVLKDLLYVLFCREDVVSELVTYKLLQFLNNENYRTSLSSLLNCDQFSSKHLEIIKKYNLSFDKLLLFMKREGISLSNNGLLLLLNLLDDTILIHKESLARIVLEDGIPKLCIEYGKDIFDIDLDRTTQFSKSMTGAPIQVRLLDKEIIKIY